VTQLNIFILTLLLTGTAVAAGSPGSPTTADREWLKHQEDFSEQLRQHPDKQLQQELEAQINRNPWRKPIASTSIIWPASKGRQHRENPLKVRCTSCRFLCRRKV
jgi:hypothetical protein